MTESGISGGSTPEPPLPRGESLEAAPQATPESAPATAAQPAAEPEAAAHPAAGGGEETPGGLDAAEQEGWPAAVLATGSPEASLAPRAAWYRRAWLKWTGFGVGAAALGALASGLVFGLVVTPQAETRAAQAADAAGYDRGHAAGLETGEENGKQAALEEQAQREQEAREAAQKEFDDAKSGLELSSLLCSNSRLELSSDKSSVEVDSTNGEDSKGIEAIGCMLGALGAPDSVVSKMEGTRALDGALEAEWDHYKATWRYHPKDGLDVVFEFVG